MLVKTNMADLDFNNSHAGEFKIHFPPTLRKYLLNPWRKRQQTVRTNTCLQNLTGIKELTSSSETECTPQDELLKSVLKRSLPIGTPVGSTIASPPRYKVLLSDNEPLLGQNIVISSIPLGRFNKKNLAEHFLCSICCGVPSCQPFGTGVCEHYFCKDCLHQWMPCSKVCPNFYAEKKCWTFVEIV